MIHQEVSSKFAIATFVQITQNYYKETTHSEYNLRVRCVRASMVDLDFTT
jgi:hypothetical protein